MLAGTAALVTLAACGAEENTDSSNAAENNSQNETEETNTSNNEPAEDNDAEEPAEENNAADNEETGEETEENNESDESGADASGDTITYESENGPVEVPADPQRVVVLSSYVGDMLALDVPVVGADTWSMDNPVFEEELADTEAVTDEDLEKIIELDPDLIVGLSNIQNVDQLQEIAPTVTFTYGAVDYLDQHIEIGKLVNKEDEARDWVEDFQQRASETGEEIKAEIGEDATVTVFENFDKQLYVFGDNWARGTEILYQEMELGMPESVQEVSESDGFFALSTEVMSEYAGDYIVVSKVADQDNSFQETETYQNIPAVQDGNVIEVDAQSFYFNDATSLDHQLSVFEEEFLSE
ncbi:ABC transporter substrate-binding protein [Alkalicoccus urumqiensis]|uniref:ABC transporter substrate-binding protein n=2 Tax=Alkalicoccus urumqiensis TaxID=1548213 RepID=A0A2P6MIQ1_ALKUR|nr:ABC transporter substrate-binding protein [Alkalicoccus urumqiensis]